MSDVKISGLPASTTPLAGTEVLPIVQGGQTRQVSVANLTAGRAVSATDLTLTGVATVPAGTAAAPSITTTGDPNTGIFFPAGDTIAFAEGGTEAMRINSSGNVGIGTSPSYKLDVLGTINSSAATATGFNLVFRTSGITTGRAQSGITNTSGDVYTGIEGSTAGQTLTGSAAYSGFIGTFSANPFYLATNGTIRMTLDSSGNVGVGTTSPASSAILDAQSTTKGVRMPNMTTTQKNAISSPVAGLMVFDTTLAKLCVYSGSAWQTITSI